MVVVVARAVARAVAVAIAFAVVASMVANVFGCFDNGGCGNDSCGSSCGG